jgi:hypothetical protein
LYPTQGALRRPRILRARGGSKGAHAALVQLWRILERGEDRARLIEELRALGWHEPKWFACLERMTGAAEGVAASRRRRGGVTA